MPSFTYPSADFPSEPSVALDAPDGWVPSAAPGTRLAVTTAADDDTFRSSVAVLISRHSTDYSAVDVLVALGDVAAGLQDARLEDIFSAEINERPFVGRVLVYREPSAGTLAELHMATTVEHGGIADVVHIVGTCAGDRVDDQLPLLRDIIASARISIP